MIDSILGFVKAPGNFAYGNTRLKKMSDFFFFIIGIENAGMWIIQRFQVFSNSNAVSSKLSSNGC